MNSTEAPPTVNSVIPSTLIAITEKANPNMSLPFESSVVKKELAHLYVSLEYSFSNLKIHDSPINFSIKLQGDQKVSVHLTITVQSSGAQRLFDHPVYHKGD